MRRMLFGLLPLSGLVVLSLVLSASAGACHFGGVGCNTPPEAQPYDPVSSATLADDTTAAHPDATVKWTQAEHEQFTVKIVLDLNKDFGVDLNVPTQNEQLATLNIHAIVQGAPVDLTGEITDNNPNNNPPGGIYKWKVTIHGTTGDIVCDADADKNAADGHLHFVFDACPDLITQAKATDASALEVKQNLHGSVQGGPFLTNPAAAGDYTSAIAFTAWNDPNTPETPPTVNKSVTIHINNRVPDSITLSPATAAKKIGQSYTSTATVKDQKNRPLKDASVSWQVNGGPHAGNRCQNVLTDTNGQASCSYTETTASPPDTLQATATKFGVSKSTTATVDWDQATTLDLTPASVANKRTGTSVTLTALVKDDDGVAMPGESVSFSATGANSASGSGTTGADGRATFSYTGNNAGNDTVSASVAGTPASDSSTVDWDVPTTVTVSPASASKVVQQTHAVTATVKSDDGDLMSGETVNFSVSGANTASGSGTTDGSGQAGFSYTGQNAGNDTLAASVPGTSASGTASASWAAQVATTLDLTPATAQKSINQTHTVTAHVTDQVGQPISGRNVAFSVTSGPSQGTTGSGTTDSSGNAPFSLSSPTAGTDTIQASAGSATDTSTVEWIGDIPTTLGVEYIPVQQDGGLPRHNLFLEHEQARWRLTVKDQHGNAMPNITVRMDVNTGPTNGVFPPATTNASGQATVGYTGTKANNEGHDTISLTVPGTNLSSSDAIDWTWDPCDADEPDAINIRPISNSPGAVRSPGRFDIQGNHIEYNVCV